jgi:hypothetical protein
MSDHEMYDILNSFNRLPVRENPTSSKEIEPLYEDINTENILVDSLNEKYKKFISEAETENPRGFSTSSRGKDITDDPKVNKLLTKARIDRPQAKSDMEAVLYQVAKQDDELDNVKAKSAELKAANDEQERRLDTLDAKFKTSPTTIQPTTTTRPAAPVAAIPQPSATVTRLPTPITQRMPSEIPTEVPAPAEVPAQAKQGKISAVGSKKASTDKSTGIPTEFPTIDPTIDKVTDLGQYRAKKLLDLDDLQQVSATGTFGKPKESKTMKDMLKESVQMFREYKEGDPTLGIYNYNDMLTKFKSGVQKLQVHFGPGKDLTLYDYQVYGLLAYLTSEKNPERQVANIELIMSSHDSVVNTLMLPKVKQYIAMFPEFAKKSAIYKQRTRDIEKGKFKLEPTTPADPGEMPETPVHPYQQSDSQLEENLGTDVMSDIKKNSILEGVRQVEEGKKLKDKKQFDDTAKTGDYYITSKGNKVIKTATGVKHEKVYAGDKDDDKDDLDESAKPDFLDLDKDGDTKEPMKKAAKELDEVAPPGAKAERMVKHIKKGYAKDGKLSKKEKGIAYATAWKAHNKGQVEEGTEFGDTIKNSEAKMTKVKVTEGKDAIRNHPIYTTKEAWDHYSQELAEQEMMEQSMTEAPVVDVQEELNEIARLAGLAPKMEAKCSSCGCADCKCNEDVMDESTRKHFRAAADMIKTLVDAGHKEKALEKAKIHDEIFARENPRYDSKKFFDACGLDIEECGMAPATVLVGEEEMDEGNEFTKARLDAIAAGKDTFTVGAKTYKVSGDTSDEKTQVESVNEDININVTANGEEDVVNLIRKLSGLEAIKTVTDKISAMSGEACGACGTTPCGCEEQVEEERDIEHTNTPREITAPLSAAIPSGDGENRSKQQYSKEYMGDNHMAVKEEALWKSYQELISDIKS